MSSQEEFERIKLRKEELLHKHYKYDRLYKASLYGAMVTSTVSIVIASAASLSFKDLNIFSVDDSDSKENQKITQIEKSLADLNKRFDKMEATIAKSPDTMELGNLSTRLDTQEQKQHALEETIMYDADKALTAKLLREKQASIEGQIKELSAVSTSTGDKVDTFVSNVLTIPIVGGLIALIGIGAAYVFNKFKQSTDAAGKA